MASAELLGFVDGMLAVCRGQFPKSCTTCGATWRTFGEYVAVMKPVGAPIPDDVDDDDPIGLLSLANCGCGSTLALQCGAIAREIHQAFGAALARAASERGVARSVILVELRELLRARAQA